MANDKYKKSPLKIVLIGDSGTGKTSLLSRFTSDAFNPKCKPTNAVDFFTHEIVVDDDTIKTNFWDLGGSEQFHALATSLFNDADGILLVYDISNYTTFANLTEWLNLITKFGNPKSSVKLIGNKSDMEHHRAVPFEEAEKYAADHGISFIETSALEDDHVEIAFQYMVKDIYVDMTSVHVNPNIQSTADTSSSIMNHPTASSNSNSDQQQEPFQIVLIDIRKAAAYKPDNKNAYGEFEPLVGGYNGHAGEIHCVKKPLEDQDLKFVALSYRWGEVQEQCVDTKLGYMATVTSFHLMDLYKLCYMILCDSELKSMDYVWVDAICVNQVDHEQRKATIHQMSNIYKRANYILAVPDLHLDYLRNANKRNREALSMIHKYREYIYYLVHGEISIFSDLYEQWLDSMDLPSDPALRRKIGMNDDPYKFFPANRENARDIGAKVYEDVRYTVDRLRNAIPTSDESQDNSMEDSYFCLLEKQLKTATWCRHTEQKKRRITEAMALLEEHIKDWSSRVWVISEYNIAKNRVSGNLKLWFMSLCQVDLFECSSFSFFEFKFEFDKETSTKKQQEAAYQYFHDPTFINTAKLAYASFETTMASQLNQQSFLEMILKSKASKQEDRFYSVLPLSEYKYKLTSKSVVASWNIVNLTSVKLKLYEIMTVEDRLALFFVTARFGSSPTSTATFPTFATFHINWEEATVPSLTDHGVEEGFSDNPHNLDLDDDSSLKLIHCIGSVDSEHVTSNYKLSLWPQKFLYHSVLAQELTEKDRMDRMCCYFPEYTSLWKSLQVNFEEDAMFIVFIPLFGYEHPSRYKNDTGVYLIGSIGKNKWLLTNYATIDAIKLASTDPLEWEIYDNSQSATISFDIY